MGSGARRLSDIWHMLDVCLKGHHRRLKLHRYWVSRAGLTYRGLPKGPHGSTDPEIQVFQIRRLAGSGLMPCC